MYCGTIRCLGLRLALPVGAGLAQYPWIRLEQYIEADLSRYSSVRPSRCDGAVILVKLALFTGEERASRWSWILMSPVRCMANKWGSFSTVTVVPEHLFSSLAERHQHKLRANTRPAAYELRRWWIIQATVEKKLNCVRGDRYSRDDDGVVVPTGVPCL